MVYRAMEFQAAVDLKSVRIEVAVDRQPILRLSYLLAGVVAVICLYLAVSPKNLLTSAARVVWPWSSISAPTRVTIDNVQPGDAKAFHGDLVAVTAEVRGLKEGEQVLLTYSTADGQLVDQIIPMTAAEDGYRFKCQLPPGDLGLQQDHTYFISAGDCRTPRYKIEVQAAPVITVNKSIIDILRTPACPTAPLCARATSRPSRALK